MSKRYHAPAGVALAIVAVLAMPAPSSAQVKVIISGGFFPAYREVVPEFERTTGLTVTTASGASQGTGPDTIGALLRRGELADVVIMNRRGLGELLVGQRPSRWSRGATWSLRSNPSAKSLNMPGVAFAGTIPPELQHVSVYAAAIVVGSKEPDASRRLIAFLASDNAAAAIKRSGMEPSSRR